MNFKTHIVNNTRIAELDSDDLIINGVEDAVDLLGNLYYQDFQRIILHEKNLNKDFFDLKTRIAGDILQKFSNYRMQLAIVGNFSKFQSKSLKDFIFESNKSRQINFVGSVSEALDILSPKLNT